MSSMTIMLMESSNGKDKIYEKKTETVNTRKITKKEQTNKNKTTGKKRKL